MKPDDTQLFRLYVEERRSLHEIGRLFGVHGNQIRRWLLRAGIATRSVSEGTSLAQKGKPLSEAHRAAVRENAAKARAARTPEGLARIAEKNRERLAGKPAHNKGQPWTPEQRAKHMAIRRTPEYLEKLAASQRGERSHRWRGGKYADERRGPIGWKWRLLAQECYERDGWTCQDCGCHCLNTKDSRRESKRKIQAHHIVSRRDGGSDDLENLITLCMACHGRRDMHRPRRE